MLKLKIDSYRNQWFVEGSPVENIIIYHVHGEVLNTKRTVLTDGSEYSYTALEGFPGVEQVTKRNKVKYDRTEHFFCKGTLYIHAALFKGYGTVNTETRDFDGLQFADRQYMEIQATDDTVIKVTEQRWGNYRNSAQGHLADAVAAVFNKRVAGHRNDHISQGQAQRLIEALGDINAAANGLLPVL